MKNLMKEFTFKICLKTDVNNLNFFYQNDVLKYYHIDEMQVISLQFDFSRFVQNEEDLYEKWMLPEHIYFWLKFIDFIRESFDADSVFWVDEREKKAFFPHTTVTLGYMGNVRFCPNNAFDLKLVWGDINLNDIFNKDLVGKKKLNKLICKGMVMPFERDHIYVLLRKEYLDTFLSYLGSVPDLWI